jgi:hypothetical protein
VGVLDIVDSHLLCEDSNYSISPESELKQPSVEGWDAQSMGEAWIGSWEMEGTQRAVHTIPASWVARKRRRLVDDEELLVLKDDIDAAGYWRLVVMDLGSDGGGESGVKGFRGEEFVDSK